MGKKIVLYRTFKYFLFFLLFLILSYAEIDGIRPFAFGMLFALVWCNQKIYIITPLYLLAGIIADFSINNLIALSATCFVFVMAYFLHQKFKKPLNKMLIGLYAFLSQGAYLFLNSYGGEEFFKAVCATIIGIVCLYAYLFFMQGLFVRGLRRKLLLDEGVCGGVLMLAIGVGLASIPDYCGIVSKFLLLLFVCVLFLCLEKQISISFSLLLGVGTLLHSKDFVMFLLICVVVLTFLVTSNSKKIFLCLSLLLADMFVNLYFFSYYNIYLFLPTIMACLCIMLIPQKTIQKIKNYFIAETEQYAWREMINRSREQMVKKIFETSVVFKEMQKIYLAMSKKSLNPDDAISYILEQLNFDVCGKCSNKNCPYAQIMQTDEEIKTLISLAISRGFVSVVDLSPALMKKCQKITILINEINKLVKEYNEYAVINCGVNSSRLLLADQLGGVQEVLDTLSQNVRKTISFNQSLENQIMEELIYEYILCSEALVYYKDDDIESVTLNIKTKSVNNNKIEKIVSNRLKTKMKITNVNVSEKPGYSIVILNKAYGYDVVFGSAQQTKWGSPVSGDTFSVTRIGNSKVFMSVCDGMGSGNDANNISTLSLNLIEKFYEAGFGSNLIIKNVNKLLSLREEDSFSAIDICVFDLTNASCRLIKIGASLGFIKQKEQTLLVKTSALPLGILEDVKPCVKSYALNDGDMVILLSDGVVDAWEDVMKLKNLINNLGTENPQTIADIILEETLKLSQNYAEDDMTVLVGKIWKNI